MRPLADDLQKEIDFLKDDLASGKIELGDYPHIIGVIKGLRKAIDIAKEWEAKNMNDGEEEWQEVRVDDKGGSVPPQ